MGYRSEVAIAIYGPEKAMLPMIAAQRMLKNSPLTFDKDGIEQRKIEFGGEDWLILKASFEGVKWYESYPEVQAWNSLLLKIDEEEPDLAYEFVRIGEEITDTEFNCSPNAEFWLNIHRSIEDETPDY